MGELRIPALAVVGGRAHLFFDVRPAPASGSGADFIGTTLASDLPNPNWIAHMSAEISHQAAPQLSQFPSHECGVLSVDDFSPTFFASHPLYRGKGRNKLAKLQGSEVSAGLWSDPEPVSMPAPIASDAAVCATSRGIFLAYGSTESVGYFESRAGGEQLEPWVAFGATPDVLEHRNISAELYAATGADAIFATSGSTIEFAGRVLVPYVARWGERTGVVIVHFDGTRIAHIAEPITAPGVLLDETTLAVVGNEVWANFRVQGFAGRGSGVRFLARSRDGVRFSEPAPLELPDPGCNAKQLGELFLHPGSPSSRENGAIERISNAGGWRAERVLDLGDSPFGYCDAAWLPSGHLLVVFERDAALWQVTVVLAE
ncbi:sialidase family protein [Arcanobacterium wilhelmae]|nr:sialidase family protein [Arcanobacterium wilhelmae]WFN91170.1 sialidase family protein [Arcanobacterium wilhelmae]